jgi:hypothetical protein
VVYYLFIYRLFKDVFNSLDYIWSNVELLVNSDSEKIWKRIRDSSVCMMTGYGLNDRVSIPGRDKNGSPLQSFQTGSGAHPAFYSMDIQRISSRVKKPEREVDGSSPFRAKFKNAGSYTSILLHTFKACCLIKHSNNFTLYFIMRVKVV